MFESNEFLGRNDDRETCRDARNDDAARRQRPPPHPRPPPRRKQQIKNRLSPRTAPAVDRWVEEQMFEEDVRAVLLMMRPHSRERLMGWSEYRTGGKHFRATVSWDEEFAADAGTSPDPEPADDVFSVPNFADVLEALLVGSIRS